MKSTTLAGILCVVLANAAYARAHDTTVPVEHCAPSLLEIEGNRIWVDKEGSAPVTVVFEAGFGNDSSVWAQIAPRVRAAGVQTFVYDRAGMGKSSINEATPYSIDNDVHILRTAMKTCAITGPVVMVGHSYGGAMSLVAAPRTSRSRAWC